MTESKNNDEKEWYSIGELSEMMMNSLGDRPTVPEMDYNAGYFKKLDVIKKYYEASMPEFTKEYERTGRQHFNAYPFEWDKIFTPIELSAWNVIRCMGLPLFPQFPVGQYFLDFANPFKKIGVELDGKNYHNAEKDAQRDANLKTLGWKIVRITGTEMERGIYWEDRPCFDVLDLPEEEYKDVIRNFMFNTGHGVLHALHIQYWGGNPNGTTEEVISYAKSCCELTINAHTLI